ncbi:hypothetical protein ACHAW5_010570 [Stephanodiscus triporus]|uniref:Uncharacterized protein n=1 Tax=Stephanodiscus triporus TaxID=2934178 RepID=A0ABD3PLS4_9STRA
MSAYARVRVRACASPATAAIVASRISIGRAPPLPLLGSIKPMLAVCRASSIRVGAAPHLPPHRPSRHTLAGGPERRGRSLVLCRLGLSSNSSSSTTMTTMTTTSGCPPAGRRIFRIGAKDNGSGGRAGRPACLSNLSPQLSAALEDHLLARMNGDTTTTTRGGDGRRTDDHDHDNHDRRLINPILGRSITRAGLNWVRSLSVLSLTSSRFAAGGNRVVDVDDDDEEYDDKDSIVMMICPPTMLHPRLDELAAGLADFAGEGAASWIEESGWMRLTVDVYPTSLSSSSLHGDSASLSSSAVSASASVSSPDRGRALRDVSHVLAVYSCKGGVGKSTVAVNLAYRLLASGGRIGLVDLDVYGPSLPLLVRPDDPTVRQSSLAAGLGRRRANVIGVRLPRQRRAGELSGGGGAAVMRGPTVGKVMRQLLHGMNWGSLDVLVLDLPPRTRDIQLKACQSLSLSGASSSSSSSSSFGGIALPSPSSLSHPFPLVADMASSLAGAALSLASPSATQATAGRTALPRTMMDLALELLQSFVRISARMNALAAFDGGRRGGDGTRPGDYDAMENNIDAAPFDASEEIFPGRGMAGGDPSSRYL